MIALREVSALLASRLTTLGFKNVSRVQVVLRAFDNRTICVRSTVNCTVMVIRLSKSQHVLICL